MVPGQLIHCINYWVIYEKQVLNKNSYKKPTWTKEIPKTFGRLTQGFLGKVDKGGNFILIIKKRNILSVVDAHLKSWF